MIQALQQLFSRPSAQGVDEAASEDDAWLGADAFAFVPHDQPEASEPSDQADN